MAKYDRAAAIKLAKSVKEEEIDYSDIPDVTEMLAQGKIKLIGRPKKAVTKKPATIRFSPDVLTRLRQMGRGWQTKVDQVMREWLDKTGTL
jgi:uncharacterized protein (DUF4415 family)